MKNALLRWCVMLSVSWCVGSTQAGLVDISGYQLNQYSAPRQFTTAPGTYISDGGYLIVARDVTQSEFEAFWEVSLAIDVVYIESGDTFPIINGDEIYDLQDDASVLLDGPTISKDLSWDNAQRIAPAGDPSSPTSWSTGPYSAATPGSGVAPTGTAGLIISEFSDATGSGNYRYEFVEIYLDTIPEPSTLVLLGVGVISLLAYAWHRRRSWALSETLISISPAGVPAGLVVCARWRGSTTALCRYQLISERKKSQGTL